MSKLGSVLKDEIARVARKEAKALFDPLKKQVSAQRGIINDLRQQLAERTKQLQVVVREMARGAGTAPHTSPAKPSGSDFSAKGFVALRKRLKLTQEGMAKVLEVSPQTIYNWERGTKPKEKYQPRIAKLQAMSENQAAALAGAGKPAKAVVKVKKASKAAATKAAGKKAPVKKAAAKTSPAKKAPKKAPAKKAAKKVSRKKSVPGSVMVPATT